jgi:hypothetical protein
MLMEWVQTSKDFWTERALYFALGLILWVLLMRVSYEALLVPEVKVAGWTGNPVPLENFVVILKAVFVHVQHVLVRSGTVLARQSTLKMKITLIAITSVSS